MPRLQQEVEINTEHLIDTGFTFLNKPVLTSDYFCTVKPMRYYKGRKKRLLKKWCKRYGTVHTPRKDALVFFYGVVCHTSTAWRFNPNNLPGRG